MHKIRLYHWFILEIWLSKKSHNLIGWEHLDQHCTLCLWLLNASLLQLCLLDPQQWLERSYGPSFFPAVCLDVFFGIGSLNFCEFWHDARNPYEIVHDRARVFGKNFFAPKMGKWAKKKGFFNLKKNLVVNVHWICSFFVLFLHKCCIGKILFLRYRPKCFQLIRLQDF